MATDSGNTLLSARSLNLATGSKTRRETIGGTTDSRDFFKFNLTSRSSLDLTLKKLRANVDVALLDSTRKVIAFSRRADRLSESIKTTLDAGTFYIRLNAKEGSTGYQLTVAATTAPGGGGGTGGGGGGTPANTAPTIGTNTPLAVSRNGTGTIGRTSLVSTDTQQTGDQLVYRVTTLPKAGSLFLNGTPLGVGSAFTQTDIDNNRITYKQNSVKSIPNTGRIFPETTAKISGANIVWAAQDSTGDTEVYLYRGSTGTITQLSNNDVADSNPEIFGSNVVWQSGTDNAAEIYLFNINSSTSPQNISNAATVEDSNAKLSDSYVVWQRKFGSGASAEHDIMYYKLSDGTLATVNGESRYDDTNPAISGSKIAFQRDDKLTSSTTATDGIYFRDLALAGIATQVDSGSASYTDADPQIFGSTVAWRRQYFIASDVRYSTNPLSSGSLGISTPESLFNQPPLISGPNIVFSGSSDINGAYLFNTATSTATPILPRYASIDSIDGNWIGWTSSGGTANLYNIATGTSQVLDGGVPTQGTVRVSGGNATWVGSSGTGSLDRLFFYDTSIASDSFSFSVSDGSLTTNGTFNLTVS